MVCPCCMIYMVCPCCSHLDGVSMLYDLDGVSMLYDLDHQLLFRWCRCCMMVSMLYYFHGVSMLYDLDGVSMLYYLQYCTILFGFTSCVHSDGSFTKAWVATHAIPFHYNIAHRLQLRVSQWVFPAAVFFLNK